VTVREGQQVSNRTVLVTLGGVGGSEGRGTT
jgi:hypothetical protein